MVLLSDSQVLKTFSYPAGWNRKLDYYHFFIQLENFNPVLEKNHFGEGHACFYLWQDDQISPNLFQNFFGHFIFDLGNDVLDT